MRRALLLSLALALPGLMAGCEAPRLQAAQREDSVAAYRRFLATRPQATRAEAARQRLEELLFLEARRADRPLGYRQYLQELPHGRFAGACRARLAQLALAGARSAADLQLVVERHPGTSEAAQAAARLPAMLAAEAKASSSPDPAQRFLDRYPGAAQAPAVRAHLAALRYRDLPDEVMALESFIEAFGGTPPAVLSLQRLERLLADEVAASGEPELLAQLRVRFPLSARLPELQRVVQKRRLRRTLARLDLAALAELARAEGDEAGTARQVVAWCGKRAARCKALAELAGQAAPWRPVHTLEALRGKVYDADLAAAWRAIAALALLDEAGAAALLLELAGAERISTVWMAERSLLGWLSRHPAERRSFAAAELRRPFREVNDDERQRRGALLLLTGQGPRAERLLGPLLERPGRQLAASFLLLRQARRQAIPAGALLARFLTAARARLDWLKQAFPADLQPASTATAQLCEHELFALVRATASVTAPGAAGGELLELQRSGEELLARWRLQLGKAQSGYRPAEEPGPEPAEQAHQRGRTAALQKLRADRSPIAKLVVEAVCDGHPSSCE